MRRVFLIFIVIIVMSGCAGPKPTHFKAPQGGGPIYQKAWKEGCGSGFSAYGNDYWRSFYHYKSDVKLMITNKVYSRVWWDSFNYCRHYLNRYLMDGYWGSEGFGSGDEANFNGGLRNTRAIEEGGFSFPYWQGSDIPGWGEAGWGSDVEEGDWLWRQGGDKVDWLGRSSAYQTDFK